MKKKNAAPRQELQLLHLLKQVLPKATEDPDLAGRIYAAVEQELKAQARGTAFEAFCTRMPLPNLEPDSLAEVQQQLQTSFADADVTIKPNRKEKSLSVEVALPDGTQFTSVIPVNDRPAVDEAEDPEATLQLMPFPVALPGDPELVWVLGRRENLTAEEAAVLLAKVEEDFWASKMGQKLQRDRVEKCFPEFIARVQSGRLTEVGLKRHYKTPEPVKVLRSQPARR